MRKWINLLSKSKRRLLWRVVNYCRDYTVFLELQEHHVMENVFYFPKQIFIFATKFMGNLFLFPSRFLRAALLAEEFRVAALREVVSQLPREHFRKVSRKKIKKEKVRGGGDRIKGEGGKVSKKKERRKNSKHERNKDRLISTTCGEELQKNYFLWVVFSERVGHTEKLFHVRMFRFWWSTPVIAMTLSYKGV